MPLSVIALNINLSTFSIQNIYNLKMKILDENNDAEKEKG